MTETSTTRGSGRASSTLVDVHGPGTNKFWRKTCVDTNNDVLDTTVSAAYPDLFDGKATTSVISGGMENSFYLSDFPLASRPPFGDAKLDGANLFFYVTNIDKTEPATAMHIPSYSFYMVDASIGTGNEGNITPYPTGQWPDSPLATFSSHFSDEGYWQNEDFSNGENAKVVAGSVIIQTDPYLPLKWAIENTTDYILGRGSYHTGGRKGSDPTEWRDYTGSGYDEMTDILPNGEEVIFVEKKGWNSWGWDEQWMPVKGRQYFRDDPEWEAKQLKGTGYPKYAYTTEGTYTLSAPATTENTFFDEVKRLKSETLYSVDEGGLLHGTEIVFNSEDTLSGGGALMMHSRFDETKSGTLGWSKMKGSGYPYVASDSAAKGENSGRVAKHYWVGRGDAEGEWKQNETSVLWVPHRQRAVVVKKLPLPVLYAPHTGMDWTGEHGKIHREVSPGDAPLEDTYPDTGDVKDRNISTSEIDITLKVEELNYAPFFVGKESTWNNPHEDGLEWMGMDARSVCIMLGTRPPRDAESFFDYYYNTNCNDEGWNGAGTGATLLAPGSSGDRDGLSTGMLIARPNYTDYTYKDSTTENDGVLVKAKGRDGAGKGYRNGAERWKDSNIGRNFVSGGLVCLPFVSRKYVNKVNGHDEGLDGDISNKNRWSICGGVKSNSRDKDGNDAFGWGGVGSKDNDYNSSYYLSFLRARFAQDDLEDYVIPIPDKEWLRIRIFLNGDSTDEILFQIEDAQSGDVIGRSYMSYVEAHSIWGGDAHPLYLSIWCNNFPGSCNTDHNGNTARRYWGEAKSTRFTTQTKVLIDEIKLKKFNMSHNNASTDNANTNKSALKIKRNVVTNAWMQKTTSPTYLSFWYENATDLMDGATYLFFNGLGGDTATPTAIGNNYIRATVSMVGWSVDGLDDERLGLSSYFDGKCYASGTGAYTERDFWISPFKHWADSNTHVGTANFQIAGRGLSINGSETGGAGAFWDGTKRAGGIPAGTQQITMTGNETDTENFSQKGLLKFNYSSGQILEIAASSPPEKHLIHNYNIAKRENDYVAARIIDVDIEAGEITVDDPGVLQLKEGIQYRIYHRGSVKKPSSNNWQIQSTYQDVYLSTDAISGNIVKIKSELNRWFIDGKRNGYEVRNNLWISPLLNWLIIEALPYDSSGEKVEDRTYRSVVEVNRGNTSFPTSTDYGVTYNETTYNDGINQNSWSLDFTLPDTQVETETDFGFGSLTEEGSGGGELGKVKVRNSNLWHSVDLSGAVNAGGKKEGDILTTIMAPKAISSFVKTTIATTESTTKATADDDWYLHGSAHYEGVFRPFLLTTFRDELPVIEDFNISPTEGREFFPKFTWKCSDDDIWYGFIIVDDKMIHHQYQNAVLHMPLNTPKVSNKAPNVLAGKKTSDIPDWYSWVNDINGTSWAKKLSPTTPFTYPLFYQLEDLELAFDPEGLSGWCHRFTQPTGNEAVNALNLFSTNADVDAFGFRGTCPQKEMSLILHVTPDYTAYPSTQNQMLFDNGGGVVYGDGIPDSLKFFKVYIDVNGYVAVEICPTNCQETSNEEAVSGTPSKVVLKSVSLIPVDGVTPTNIIVTLDAGLKKNNLKLFINGKLEDTTGKSYTDMTLSTSNRWPFDTKMSTGSTTSMITIGNVRSLRKVNSQSEPFRGRMEEVVYYNKCIYPVDVDSGEFILEKPLKELAGNNQSKSYSARLFVKDYHNIRGTTTDKVASTTSTSWRKSTPLFTEASE